MKKGIPAILIALIIAVMTVAPCLALDNEDPLVVANEDFWIVRGWDNPTELWGQDDPATWDWVEERHWGEVGYHPKNPADGYNLYRDDITDTGNLDVVWVYPPSAVDMPNISGSYEGDFSPDTWYWAKEPRGYDNPIFAGYGPSWLPLQNQFHLWFGGIYSYKWIDGNSLPAIDQESSGYWNGVPYTMRVVIPDGTQVYGGYCLRLCYADGGLTFRDLNGQTITFSNPVIIYELIDGKWVESHSSTVF